MINSGLSQVYNVRICKIITFNVSQLCYLKNAKSKFHSFLLGKTVHQSIYRLKMGMPSMVVHICNPSTQEAEEGGLRIQSQCGLQSKTQVKKKKGNKNTITIVLQDWSPELLPDGIFKNTPERPTTWGSGTLAGAVDLSLTISGRLQRSWPQNGGFCHQHQKNMAAGEVVWTCTPNPGLEQGKFL
jgi:hypothetical protein